MISDEWIEAGRRFRLLDESGRASYWAQLTPAQQRELTEALSVQELSQPLASDSGKADTSKRRGCGGTFAVGCIGVLIGIALTIFLEVAALMLGVQFVGDALDSMSTGTERYSAPAARETRPAGCEDPEYAEAHVYECDPGRYTYEWRRNREMNERDGQAP